MNQSESLMDIGKIVGTHGLRGDVKVHLTAGDPDPLMAVQQVNLNLPAGEQLKLGIVRQVVHKGQVLLRFKGYDSINQVEQMVGGRVLIAESELPDLDDGEYYWSQLNGLQVVDLEKGTIGHLKKIFTTAAHDTYVVQGPYGEILIPAVKEFILAIDLEEQIMQVALPQGLVPEES
ncbi:MAG: ribosome maturation factor RimM [Deltaproteobacteria bacterium]|jgi:16S rRNA processing protein RimM|nr:ribosome maturation factor RimM [Deltaproteobacteria bacterium]MCW9048754.1 ribosome maturation factor RimM [Deltaproteobacteria bacterium]